VNSYQLELEDDEHLTVEVKLYDAVTQYVIEGFNLAKS